VAQLVHSMIHKSAIDKFVT